MTDRTPKPYSEIQDRNQTKNPKSRDQIADNSTYTRGNPTGHRDEPSTSRAGNSIETITPSADNQNAGGMIAEG